MKVIPKTEAVTDEALVARFKGGDVNAFEALYDRYLHKVYARVRAQIPSSDVEDVTQEVFISVLRSLPAFRAISAFSTWVIAIANKKVADFYRRKYLRPVESLEEHQGWQPAVEAKEGETMVKEVLHKLHDRYREILIERLAEGRSFQEIAQLNGSSLEAAKSMYRRALETFKKEWEKV